MTKHKYKNPPIIEAICEFNFALPTDAKAHFLTLPGLLQKELEADYTGRPRERRVQSHTIASSDGSPQQTIEVEDRLFRIELPTDDNTRLIAVGPESIAVGILKPYSSWDEDFYPRVRAALDAYFKLVEPIHATRIGVRYINHVVVNENTASPTRFFQNINPTPDPIEGELAHFLQRLEYTAPDNVKTIVTHATLTPTAPDTTVFLLDIDIVWDHDPIDHIDKILAKAVLLHKREGAAFETLITDETRKLLDA